MVSFKNKEQMNTLLNIDSIFGEYEGHVLPIVITLILAGVPILVWLFLLQGTFIKLWWVLVFDVLWTGRWALIILGKENEKMQFYMQQRSDEYKSANELVHIQFVHEDGLIEYDNGSVAYIISGYPKGYLTDDKLSVDMEKFMDELDMWNWDLYLHNTIDELLCEEELPKLSRYTDKDITRERISFYSYQDEWSRTHSGLYRYSFLVRAGKADWKKLKEHLSELVSSEMAGNFNELSILNYDDVMDILGRDICGFIDINKMLIDKYENSEYYGSRVLWYDENVPKELVKEPETTNMESRRV